MTVAEPQTLPHTLAAPGLARKYVTSAAAGFPAELLDVATLLTSEVVTNAVVHGLGPVQLLLRVDAARLTVEVSDGAPEPLPCARSTPTAADESGRGLLIVERLADRWGCRPRRYPPGKVVWFDLLRPRSG